MDRDYVAYLGKKERKKGKEGRGKDVRFGEKCYIIRIKLTEM